jgi:predicted ATPase/DNA-binding winged helix-turn-helix (wHTH) protein
MLRCHRSVLRASGSTWCREGSVDERLSAEILATASELPDRHQFPSDGDGDVVTPFVESLVVHGSPLAASGGEIGRDELPFCFSARTAAGDATVQTGNLNETRGPIRREAFFGPFHLIPSRRVLLCGERVVRLGEPSYNVLLGLIEEPGAIVDPDTLMRRAWGPVHVDETSLRSAIAALRRALSDTGSTRTYVATIPRRGYRFVERVVYRDSTSARRAAPLPSSRVFGRDGVIDDLVSDFSRHRLITVVGPGGIGKTTTALGAVYAAFERGEAESIGFVALDTLEDARLLARRVQEELGVVAESGDPMTDIEAFLDNRRMLIVMDSCERMVPAVASLIERILSLAPKVIIVATSREPLWADGERIRRLDALTVPPAGTRLTAAEMLTFGAVELFVDRATASYKTFQLTDENAGIVGEICRRLDGLPLALEVAAARIDSFAPSTLADVLEGRFHLQLRAGTSALSRHRTLAASLDWSFDALSEPERTALRRLSVFRGPFSFDAARNIVGFLGLPAGDVGTLIASLAAKSLLAAGHGRAQGKHRLLDTTRAYAREKLEQSGEEDAVCRRHAAYYEALLVAAIVRVDLIWTSAWDRAYGPELDQFRAAVDWATSSVGDPKLTLSMTLTALPVLNHMGLQHECLAWVDRVRAAQDFEPCANQILAMEVARAGALGFTDKTGAMARESWRSIANFEGRVQRARQKLQVLYAQYSTSYASGQFRDSLTFGQRFRDVAGEAGDKGGVALGERLVGNALFHLGHVSQALCAIERALDCGPALSRAGFDAQPHFDERVAAFCNQAKLLLLKGSSARALRIAAENVDRALATGHGATICLALGLGACPIAQDCRDLALASQFTEAFSGYVKSHPGLGLWNVLADVFEGALLTLRGDYDSAATALLASVGQLRFARMWPFLTMGIGYLATALYEAGRVSEARIVIEDGIERCERSDELWCLPRFVALKAQVSARGRLCDAEEISRDLSRALSMADQLGTKFWRAQIVRLSKSLPNRDASTANLPATSEQPSSSLNNLSI